MYICSEHCGFVQIAAASVSVLVELSLDLLLCVGRTMSSEQMRKMLID